MKKEKKIRSAINIEETIKKFGEEILENNDYIKLKKFIQHNHTNTYNHSIAVAKKCLAITERMRLKKVDTKSLVRGSLLHDFYLYDWHHTKEKWHGFIHPGRALENAEERFSLNKKEKEVIKKHMWPLTIVPPLCAEAWIIVLADKIVATREFFGFIG